MAIYFIGVNQWNKRESRCQCREKRKKKLNFDLPALRVQKTAEQVIQDSLKWGQWVVSDNRFHYGMYGKKDYVTPTSKYYEGGKYVKIHDITHSCGCPICGTEKKKKMDKAAKLGYNPEDWRYTYVCNTFATAMYAHGGQDNLCLSRCQAGGAVGMNSEGRSPRFDKDKNWQYLGKLPIKDLKAGDVLVSASHMQTVYAPVDSKKVKIIESTSYIGKYRSAASDNSIRIKTKTPSYTSVYRFIGSVDAVISIKYGEYSDRVKQWQNFLLYIGYDCGIADGKFGEKTTEATIMFQGKYGLTADGIVGKATLAKAEEILEKS